MAVRLHDGREMPPLGYGTWRIPDDQAEEMVRLALLDGYRLVDTAEAYENEAGVGRGIRSSGIPRDSIFVTTKVWNDRQGFDETLRACDESLGRLGLEAVDLYLIHWPAPRQGRYVETWRALVRLQQEGRARSIGVSNFHERHLREVIDATGVVPAVNQIEVHPFLQQAELRRVHRELGIVTECWSPLAKGALLSHPALGAIGRKHGKTAAQVVLRWHLEDGMVPIPKSVTPSRIRENLDVFDFRLDEEDLAGIAALDEGRRVGPDPEVFE